MKADENILQLPHVSLKNRNLLPEKSGIYYVLDEQLITWYIGQAKNLRSRWSGESHHRSYQLKKQRKKQFTIYYELVPELQLDAMEKQRIEQYNPQLNSTKVKVQKLHPTETLLRETLILIAPYSFVLGVEPPRKEDPKFIEDSISWRDDWRVQKAVLPLKVIHICVNRKEIKEVFKDSLAVDRFLSKAFKKRSNYSDNWAYKATERAKRWALFPLRRLLVNGFAIEVYEAREEAIKHIQDYKLAQIAGVQIRTLIEADIAILKDKCLLNSSGMYTPFDNQEHPYDQLCRKAIKRIFPYKEDLIKLFFNEDLDTSKLQNFPIAQKITEESDSGFPVRLANLAAKKEYLKSLLRERGFNLNRYQVNKYLERIPTDENYVDNNKERRMIIYVKSFSGDLRKLTHYSTSINGSKGYIHQSQNSLDCPYKEVYLASTVDRVFWLLLESYLSDFAKVNLNEEEGYAEKVYVSPRKFLVPAMLTVTLNGKWKTDIPFGAKGDMSYVEVVNTIKTRLQESGIPKLKFSFKSESTSS